MEASFNCYVLNFSNTYVIEIYNERDIRYAQIGSNKYKLDTFMVGNISNFICQIKKVNCELKLWRVNIKRKEIRDKNVSTEEDIVQKLYGKDMEPGELFQEYFQDELNNQNFIATNIHIIAIISTTSTTVKDAIDIALKNVIRVRNDKPELTIMPFMERDFNDAITRITRNIQNNHKKSKSKTDFDILFIGGTPGIGKTRYGDELFKHLKNNQNWVPPEWKNNLHIESLYLDFGSGCKLDSYDDDLSPEVIIGLRIAFVFFIESKYDMKFVTFCDRVLKYKDVFKISNVFEFITEHLNLEPEQQLFVFLHIDEF
ncbi:hypothetical protein GLOIN_2v414785 [Rhizophagus clarus]|uniref:Uncharacterized protein n=1 Tax=Rhizophagus clarus TaxID=94130 RepID=A0A8H3LDQ3_9GLOM|nr:hypothetical protein GLOIN_2v414785 [Rhizophagus clarus]